LLGGKLEGWDGPKGEKVEERPKPSMSTAGAKGHTKGTRFDRGAEAKLRVLLTRTPLGRESQRYARRD